MPNNHLLVRVLISGVGRIPDILKTLFFLMLLTGCSDGWSVCGWDVTPANETKDEEVEVK